MSFFRPGGIPEALKILKEEEAAYIKPLAGGTDIGVARAEGTLKCDGFLDLSSIPGLSYIREEDGYVVLGALVTHGEAAASPLIQNKAPILSQACITVGSPQIRNRGTLGGNINHASPSGDSIPALMALNAEVKVESAQGERRILLEEYFTGPGKTVRYNTELLTEIWFKPLNEKYYCLYQKLGQRKSLSCSKASMAFVAAHEADRITDVRIAMGAVAPTVVRGHRTEAFLEGKVLTKEIIEQAAEIVRGEVSPIDDLRSTASYRKEMMGVLITKALHRFIRK